MKRNRKAGRMIRGFNVTTGKVKMVDPANLKPGPIRHEALDPADQAIARFTFERLGHFQCPTFEQWELGFLRDAHPDRELMLWLRASIAFARYLETHTQANVKKVHRDIVSLLVANPPETPRQYELERLSRNVTREDIGRAMEAGWRDEEGGCDG